MLYWVLIKAVKSVSWKEVTELTSVILNRVEAFLWKSPLDSYKENEQRELPYFDKVAKSDAVLIAITRL